MQAQNQAQDRPAFKLNPGDGWLFPNARNADVVVFQGHFRLEKPENYQAIATLNTTEKKFEVVVREFQTWKEITRFEAPMIGDNPYSEAVMAWPLDKPEEIETPEGTLKITTRKYKVRFYRDNKRQNVLRWTFPQIKAGITQGGNTPM